MTKLKDLKVERDLYYILDGHDVLPVSCEDWAKWFELATIDRSRVVTQEHVGPYYVSTVFLGIDHRFSGEGPPIVFETMVFDIRKPGGRLGDEVGQWRCCTWQQAVKLHEAVRDHASKAAANGGVWPGDPEIKGIYEEEEDDEANGA